MAVRGGAAAGLSEGSAGSLSDFDCGRSVGFESDTRRDGVCCSDCDVVRLRSDSSDRKSRDCASFEQLTMKLNYKVALIRIKSHKTKVIISLTRRQQLLNGR